MVVLPPPPTHTLDFLVFLSCAHKRKRSHAHADYVVCIPWGGGEGGVSSGIHRWIWEFYSSSWSLTHHKVNCDRLKLHNRHCIL